MCQLGLAWTKTKKKEQFIGQKYTWRNSKAHMFQKSNPLQKEQPTSVLRRGGY